MLDSARLLTFIGVRDLDRARSFYGSTLGLPVVETTPFAVVVPAAGSELRLTPVPDLRPQAFTVGGFDVADIRSTIAAFEGRGVRFLRYDHIDQDDSGIWTTPGGDQVAWFSDPFGNTLSLTTFHRSKT